MYKQSIRMNKIALTLNQTEAAIWNQLPPACQDMVAEKAIQAMLNGELYPTGPDQLELAITLAENGVEPQVISQITRLDASVFEAFLS